MIFSRCVRQLLLFCFFVMLLSCTVRYTPSETAEESNQETRRFENQINDERDALAKEHLQLAWFYLDYRNPGVDYGGALKEFEAYLTLAPDGENKDEIQNWVSILWELEILKRQNMKLQEQILDLAEQMGEGRGALEQQVKRNKKLSENIKKLQESNARLKETIKKLKTLDRQIEEKRRSVK